MSNKHDFKFECKKDNAENVVLCYVSELRAVMGVGNSEAESITHARSEIDRVAEMSHWLGIDPPSPGKTFEREALFAKLRERLLSRAQ